MYSSLWATVLVTRWLRYGLDGQRTYRWIAYPHEPC